MRCKIILTVILFIIHLNEGSSNPSAVVKLIATEGEKVTYAILKDGYNILSCVAVHNDQVYSIYPTSNLTNDVNESTSKLCTFGFSKVSFSDAGKWTIYTTNSILGSGISQSTYTIELYVYMKTILLPKTWFTSTIGNYVTVFPQHKFPHFTNCSVRHYGFPLSGKNYDLLNLNQDDLGIELYGRCGVRILVDESKYGSWELLQNDGPYKMVKLEFKIWKSANDYDDNTNLVWLHGLPEEIGLPEYLRYTYCKIIQPDGRSTTFELGNCIKRIDKVNYIHEGVWEIQYYIPEFFDMITKQFNVKVKDELKTHDNISIAVKTTNNQTHLLCTLSGVESKFCLFIKPDGSVVNVAQGIGNNKYEYYGKGYNYDVSETPHSDCGLTIYQPSADDFGLWECSFGKSPKTLQNYRAFISFIDINKINVAGAYIPNHFYVKRGDSLQIECPRYASLHYCWLYSPNGTIYARSNHINSKKTSLFKDRNLAAGICATTIENADYEHSGNWSCLLNIVGGDEIKVSNAIVVSVTDSYLYTNQSIIKINKNGETNLTLNILPEKYVTIMYCRWHYPNGTEVQRKNSSHYSLSHDKKSCSLTINEYNAENIGKWTCYAGLFDDSDEKVFNKEISATVTVIENENNLID